MKFITVVTIGLACITPARADFIQEQDLQDMRDDYELRQRGLDPLSQQMWYMRQEIETLRWQFNRRHSGEAGSKQ